MVIYTLNLIDLVEEAHSSTNNKFKSRMMLEGVLRIHARDCRQETCPCGELGRIERKNDPISS
jgi:hypothetical protein